MKTPVRELYDRLWEADKDRFVWASILAEMIEKEKEAMERYKALLEITNEPDVEAWERKMKQRSWDAWKVLSIFDSETNRTRFEKWYNEKYESKKVIIKTIER